MIKNLFSLYTYRYPKNIAYMLQASEYDARNYLIWLSKTKNFNLVSRRKQFIKTKFSILLYRFIAGGMLLQILIGLIIIILGFTNHFVGGQYYGLAIILSYPVIWPYLILILILVAKILIINPRDKIILDKAENIFKNHPGKIIAVLGSYGKTSMKEYLAIVLSEGKKVAVSPDNKNVALSHARFAQKLTGLEDYIVLEYGEGKNGDIAKLAKLTHPDFAIITGLAPVHQNHYKSIKQQADDLLSIEKYVDPTNIYLNSDTYFKDIKINKEINQFNDQSVLGFKISNILTDYSGTSFELSNKKQTNNFKSKVIGRHQVKYLALIIVISEQLGLTLNQIKKGIAKTKAFPHRMELSELNGAMVIDDSYNGNIEGIKAGLNLIKDLKAKRKIYVTPGLVDQGKKTKDIHLEMGRYIAAASPDIVVLMQNSTTESIKKGLAEDNYAGQLIVEDNPLDFYNNLSIFVAKDDLVLMQNDWPDNYK